MYTCIQPKLFFQHSILSMVSSIAWVRIYYKYMSEKPNEVSIEGEPITQIKHVRTISGKLYIYINVYIYLYAKIDHDTQQMNQ